MNKTSMLRELKIERNALVKKVDALATVIQVYENGMGTSGAAHTISNRGKRFNNVKEFLVAEYRDMGWRSIIIKALKSRVVDNPFHMNNLVAEISGVKGGTNFNMVKRSLSAACATHNDLCKAKGGKTGLYENKVYRKRIKS
jgi:hypothetical protein